VNVFPDRSQGVHHELYAVTARHVVDGAGKLWLRMRTPGGGFEDGPVPRDAWELHHQTDVAVVRLNEPRGVTFLEEEVFITQEFVQTYGVSEGENLFFSGLFVGHYGKGMPPIVRFGNIALMPREPVTVEISKHPRTFADIEAYLVEARSWGGQSGSPAFASFHLGRNMAGGLREGNMPPFGLLGLVQGIWKDPKGAKAPDPSGEGVIEVNMGISAVVPAYNITEVLMADDFKEQRAEIAARSRSGSQMAPSATSAAEAGDEFANFDALATAIVKMPKSEVDKQRGKEEAS
jgi:hypothetical protein